jgi:AcrR family transcriptional regulator
MDKNRKPSNANMENILDISWKLFQLKGFRGISMDEICLQCEITKPTLYYYFKDKEDLFARVLVHKLEELGLAAESSGSLEDRLSRIAAIFLENFQSEYTSLVHDREHILQPENQELIRSAFRREMYDPIAEVMKQGVTEGRLIEEDPRMLTLVFLGIVNNFIGRVDELKQERKTVAEKLTRYFLKGVSNSER